MGYLLLFRLESSRNNSWHCSGQERAAERHGSARRRGVFQLDCALPPGVSQLLRPARGTLAHQLLRGLPRWMTTSAVP